MAANAGFYKAPVRSASWKTQRALIWIVLIITTIISLWPLYWLLVTSLTPTRETIKTPPDLLPFSASIDNFQRLFTQARDYWGWFANSLIITLAITFFHVVFDTMAGYAFAKKKFPGRTLLFWVILSTIMIPPHVTLVPLYIVTRNLELLNSLW